MPSDADIHNALLAIHSRLDVIEGKVTVIARADRDKLIAELEQVVRADPIIGRIYLALDGKRNQEQLVAELGSDRATISRRVTKMARRYGMVELVPGREAGKIYRKERHVEEVLDLARRVERWLEQIEKEKAKQAKATTRRTPTRKAVTRKARAR